MSLSFRLAAMAALFAVLALFSGCRARLLDVAWTLDGRAPADACDEVGDVVRVRLLSPAPGEASKEAQLQAACESGSVSLEAAAPATLLLEIVRGDQVVGQSRPLSVSSHDDGEDEIVVDIEVHTGRLSAELTVAGTPCGDAGASRFDVVLRQGTVGGDARVIEETAVTCSQGRAVYENAFVKVGARHFLYARAQVGDDAYATPSRGQLIEMRRPFVRARVDLRTAVRPPVRDAGPDHFGEGGIVDDAGTDDLDAGNVDAGDAPGGDAGAHDAGVDDGGSTDAGGSDAGSAPDADSASDGGAFDAGSSTPDASMNDASASVDGGLGELLDSGLPLPDVLP